MDEFNNNSNPFNEENNKPQDPYNQAPPQNNPYNQSYQQNYSYNQQNTPQQGYTPPQQYSPIPMQQSTGMATASLVIGIVSIVFGLFILSLPVLMILPIIGIILGIVFKCKHLQGGKGVSTAGIITSSIGLALPLLIYLIMIISFVVIFVFLTDASTFMEVFRTYMPEYYEQFYEIYGEQFPSWFETAISMFLG